MDGATALLVSRLRKSTCIFHRVRRNSCMPWTVREKLLSADILPRIPQLWNVGRTMVQTDIPPLNIVSHGSPANEIKSSDTHGLLMDCGTSRHATLSQGWRIMQPDPNHIRTPSRSACNANIPTLMAAVTKEPGTCV